MASDIEQPDSGIYQQPNADAAEYAPYATPQVAGPRCYYCGEPPLAGSALCQRCLDSINENAQKKARLSFKLGLAAILTLVAWGVVLLLISALDLYTDLGGEIINLVVSIPLVSLVLGIISISFSREAKKLGVYQQASSKSERLRTVRAWSAGASMGVVSIVIISILFLIGLITTILFFVALFTAT